MGVKKMMSPKSKCEGPDLRASKTVKSQARGGETAHWALFSHCAKLASMMALKGDTLISQATWEEMHSEPRFSQITKMPGISYCL